MAKYNLNKITEFVRAVSSLPDAISFAPDNLSTASSSTNSDESKSVSLTAQKIKHGIEGYLRAVTEDDSIYLKELSKVNFSVNAANSPIKNNQRWLADKISVLSILNRVRIEFEEKLAIEREANSIGSFLKTNAARAIILTAVVSLVTGFLSKDLFSKISGRVKWTDLGSPFPNFEVITQEKTVDLTEWTPSGTSDATDHTGKATFNDAFMLRKLRDEGKYFCVTAASTGSMPLFTSQSHQIKQNAIDMKIEGMPNIKNQAIAALDVTEEKVNKEFKADIHSIRYRGFTDEKANWCSTGIWHSTRQLVYKVKFPKDKMGNSFSFKTSFFYDRNCYQTLQPDSAHVKIDANSISWIIDKPIIGNAYRLDWNW